MIAELVANAMSERHPEKVFVPGESAVPVTGKVQNRRHAPCIYGQLGIISQFTGLNGVD